MRNAARIGRLATIVAAAAVLLSAWQRDGSPDAETRRAGATALVPPFAAGDGAANIALDDGRKRVVIRWVARRTGRIDALHVRVKVDGRGYAAGTTGVLRATTHPVRPDGRPRTGAVLTQARLEPRRSQWGGSLALRLGIHVRAGQELATVLRNEAASPRRDYFSANFLYAGDGLAGANSRNERSAAAPDQLYGLDPRELVGYSTDAGRTWRLPGGPYGPRDGRAFIPTYVQQYADGVFTGQPYYWASRASGRVAMVYPEARRAWTITHLGAFARGGAADVVLVGDGERRAARRLSGTGFVTARIPAVRVAAGATVRVTARAGDGGLELERQHADAVWARFAGLGPDHRWYLADEPESVVPLYPLPPPPGVP